MISLTVAQYWKRSVSSIMLSSPAYKHFFVGGAGHAQRCFVGWQMTKYTDPQVHASVKMNTGENSPVLAVDFSTLGSFFEENSVVIAWMESYAMGIHAFIDRIHSAGLKAFFFVDMIVLPLKVIGKYHLKETLQFINE